MSGAEAWVHLDGRLVEARAARIDTADRGLLLGDGLFETLLALDGRIVDLEAHLQRLRDSAVMLEIPMPTVDLPAAMAETLEANALDSGRAALRVTVTRGPGPRGLAPPGDAETRPTLLVAAAPSPPPSSEPLHAIIATTRRNERSPLSRLKSLGYLDNVLARREAAERGAAEAILLNTAGRLACATAANVFLVRESRLMTPSIGDGALPGIARAAILELARELGVAAGERSLGPSDLAEADEAFITNSLIGVRPLAAVEGRNLAVAGAGPIGIRLQRAYSARIGETCSSRI